MSNSDKHCCKLCGGMTSEIYVYPGCSAVGPFAFTPFQVKENDQWKDVQIRVCPRCGYIQGEIDDKD